MNSFENFLLEHKIILTSSQLRQLDIFEKALLRKNKVMNLISQKDEALLRLRHFLDSLAAVPVIKNLIKDKQKAADCGSGAGFPGIPLSIAFPNNTFDLLDSLNKRCLFLNEAAEEAKIQNVKAFQTRLGEGKPQPLYSLMTERAMGHLEDILPLCSKLLLKGGYFIAWQSSEQVKCARPKLEIAIKKSKLFLSDTFKYKLPQEDRERYLLIFVKM